MLKGIGRVSGIAGAAETVSGEVTGAYAGAKATGASNTEATVSAVAARCTIVTDESRKVAVLGSNTSCFA